VQCASWCGGHAGEWATKCTFKGCGACDACASKAALRGEGPEWKKPLRVHVTSIGGVGTTGFIEELRNINITHRILTNDPIDNDQIKHAPYSRLVGNIDAGSIPNRRFKSKLPDKMIYLHGDPARAVLSVHRRGWFIIQARKTRSDAWPHPFPRNLFEYARWGMDDLFQFEKHFDDFYSQCRFPIAFLRISEKTSHIAEMAEFLEVDEDEVRRALVPWEQRPGLSMAQEAAGLRLARGGGGLSVVPLEYNPDSHPSNNTYDDVSKEVKDSLFAKFASLRAKYDALPGFAVRGPGFTC